MIRFLIVFLFCFTANGQAIINSYLYAASCSPISGDVFPDDNAASYCEVDAVGSWGVNNATDVSVSSVAVTGREYVIEVESLANSSSGFDAATISFTVANATTYDYTFDARWVVDATTANFRVTSTGATTNLDVDFNGASSWTTYTGSFTTNATTFTLSVWVRRFSGGSIGDIVQIDNISITPQ